MRLSHQHSLTEDWHPRKELANERRVCINEYCRRGDVSRVLPAFWGKTQEEKEKVGGRVKGGSATGALHCLSRPDDSFVMNL